MCKGGSQDDVAKAKAEQEDRNRNKNIEKDLKAARELLERTVKMILLGTGESGKSTILKQMRKLYDKENYLTATEKETTKDTLLRNTVKSMKAILEFIEKENRPFASSANTELAQQVLGLSEGDMECSKIDQFPAQAINDLWNDQTVKDAFKESNKYQLEEQAEYFFKNVIRFKSFGDPAVAPSSDDFIRARVKTTGINTYRIPIKDKIFEIFDVGGQRSERKKWFDIFEGTMAMIFVVGASCYDQILEEDVEGLKNRMQEAIEQFEITIHNKAFANTHIILFLNKMDLFVQKIPKQPFSKWFKEPTYNKAMNPPTLNFEAYAGDDGVESSMEFLRAAFQRKAADLQKGLYLHWTDATDETIMQNVADNVTNMVLSDNLKNSGLV